MIYGAPIRLPGKFLCPSKQNADPVTFMGKLRESMQRISAPMTRHQGQNTIFVRKDLTTCCHIFLLTDSMKKDYPEFRKYLIPDRKCKVRVDFTDTSALRTLTKILLKKDFNLDVEIPDGFLIPTIPQRLNYILWIEDLLTALPKKNQTVSAIDIGTGPCAILSILGSKKNDWHFISTETTDEAIHWAKENINANNLKSWIEVVKVREDSILQEIMTTDEKCYDFCLCNPPFFENIEDIRKKSPKVKEKIEIYAKKEEIFSKGGETAFVKQMIKDSLQFRDRISLYTSMFGKKKSFVEILKELQNIKDVTYTKTEFCQGNTIRWGIAWTFLKSVDFIQLEKPKPKKSKKAKPPLVHSILRKDANGRITSVENILERIKKILLELEILSKLIKFAENYAEVQIMSNKNTWSHQRRKRREKLKSEIQDANNVRSETSPQTNICSSYLNDTASETKEEFNNNSKNVDSENASRSISVTDANESIYITNNNLSSIKSEFSVHLKREKNLQSDDIQSNITSFNARNVDLPVTSPDNSQQSSVSAKRKRNDEIEINKDVILDSNTQCKRSKNTANNLPESKVYKSSEDFVSNKCKRKSDWETSSQKKIKLAPMESEHQNDIESMHSEEMPLLFSTIKLRKTKEHILFEMNCPPEYNRESLHQMFQLFKNKFI
ncbi:RNA N6-adenosine-methyltransferase METTL16 [Nephila pilipes]|uniref:RNA N6-adenosine-methyltransferase METTL16 n=1 Tax=Nephila pilipes TaxID=299642 RepID=A0A8X6Q6Y1_NEPPI|nr:RNA N6-adenosine-methyltransferase METTL16 [Nephila pilipes]